jgi:hypothetical protein
MERFHKGMVAVAPRQLARIIPDRTWAKWAAQLAPVVAIEVVIAWLEPANPAPTRPATGSAKPWPV